MDEEIPGCIHIPELSLLWKQFSITAWAAYPILSALPRASLSTFRCLHFQPLQPGGAWPGIKANYNALREIWEVDFTVIYLFCVKPWSWDVERRVHQLYLFDKETILMSLTKSALVGLHREELRNKFGILNISAVSLRAPAIFRTCTTNHNLTFLFTVNINPVFSHAPRQETPFWFDV